MTVMTVITVAAETGPFKMIGFSYLAVWELHEPSKRWQLKVAALKQPPTVIKLVS